ncbi:MAG: PH domain-containing protein [Patescibacteria group bacterium]
MEKILVRQSAAVLVSRIIMVVVVSNLMLFFSSVITDLALKDNRIIFLNFIEYDTLVLFLLLIFQLIVSLFVCLAWYRNFYKVDNGQIIWHRGIVFPKETIFVINQRMEFSVEEGFWEKLLDYGSIKIKLDAKEQFVILAVSNPRYLLGKLQECQQSNELTQ